MVTFPNAKINLGLFVTEKRSDGFHNLATCFYPVEWCDVLEIIPAESTQFTLTGTSVGGSADDNLCMKAYRTVQENYKITPVKIHLHKNIPMGAGLGGGSSDAAFTVKMLNEIFRLQMTSAQMEDIVKPLGSDCAFFIKNQPVLAYGKGDDFQEFTLSLRGKYIVMVYPPIQVSTAEAYAGVTPQKTTMNIGEILSKDIHEWKGYLINDFENSVFKKYPEIASIKKQLYAHGAVYAAMSGSGAAVFGIFEKDIKGESLKPFPQNHRIQYLKLTT